MRRLRRAVIRYSRLAGPVLGVVAVVCVGGFGLHAASDWHRHSEVGVGFFHLHFHIGDHEHPDLEQPDTDRAADCSNIYDYADHCHTSHGHVDHSHTGHSHTGHGHTGHRSSDHEHANHSPDDVDAAESHTTAESPPSDQPATPDHKNRESKRHVVLTVPHAVQHLSHEAPTVKVVVATTELIIVSAVLLPRASLQPHIADPRGPPA